MRSESSPTEAKKRALAKERFWRLVFSMGGVSYTELAAMDLYDFNEVEQARLLWQNTWSKKNT